jgi:putative membrane protein
MFKHFILLLILTSLTFYGVTYYFPEYLQIEGGLMAFLLPALFLTILNSTLKPILKLLSLPLQVLSLGLFSVVINILVLYALEFIVSIFSAFSISFVILGGFINYFIVSVIISFLNIFNHWLIKK